MTAIAVQGVHDVQDSEPNLVTRAHWAITVSIGGLCTPKTGSVPPLNGANLSIMP